MFFIPASVYLINSNFRNNLKISVDSAISEQNRLCSFIKSDIYLLKMQKKSDNDSGQLAKKDIDSTISTYLNNFINEDIYLNNFTGGNIYLQILDENDGVIFSNLSFGLPLKRGELNTASEGVNYIIRDIDKKTFLFITTEIYLDSNCYKVSYIKDFSSIYENRKSMFNTLFKLNIFISLIMVISMIILSKCIVSPINKLIKSTQNIAGGNFSDRVKVLADDEIGLLSKNFNEMASVIEDKINELEKISEDKQRFIDNLAHELRTPLTSIIGYADFMRTSGCDDETRISSLNYIFEEGKRMEKLSTDLMQLIVLRKEEFKMENENIKEILEQIKNSFAPKLEAKNIELMVSAGDFSFLMNIDLIKILITNLIDNSVKASKNGDRIYLNAYKYGESNVILEVKDNGVGIPEEDIPKVMEPFYMVDKSRERAGNGVGLGLSLCAQIAEIHNARISIESRLGKGSTIKVIFNRA